jgi:hypothetical protein
MRIGSEYLSAYVVCTVTAEIEPNKLPRHLNSFTGISYLLITGSYRHPEVLSQNANETQLIHWGYCGLDYPLDVSGATGGTINDTIIICGGRILIDYKITDNCYSFKEGWKNWKSHVNLTTLRIFSASIVIGDMIWITGGYDDHDKILASTEQIHLNKTIRPGPTLPIPIWGHCMASDNDRIFVVGGQDQTSSTPVSKEVQIYNKYNIFGVPITARPMNYGRFDHACTIFYSQSYGRNVLLVAGGGGSSKSYKSAEILDFLLGPSTPWKESKFESSNLTP